MLDGDGIPFDDIRRNMQELNIINQRLGGHRVTLNGVHALIEGAAHPEPLSIVEVGCGGGDNLRVVKAWMQKQQIPARYTGIDINSECISFARSIEQNKGIRFIHSDYRLVLFDPLPHVIFSSMFCHHFTDRELVSMLRWMKQNAQLGFFINDLHRHALAYGSIKLLTALFSRSYLVRNDAPLSVQRGFVRSDWQRLFAAAGMANFTCTWKWAFRWLVTYNAHAHS